MSDSISEERKRLRSNWEKGTNCLCCGQRVHLYRFKVLDLHVKALAKLYKLSKLEDTYYHISLLNISGGGGDFAQIEKWGLIESEINLDTKKRTSGMWKITPDGIDFLLNKKTIPKYCYIFNKKARRFSEEQIGVHDALREHFDYEEMMRG